MQIIVKLFCNRLVGMNRICVAAQSADFQTGFLNGIHELLEFRLIVQQHAGIAMIFAGISAAAELYHLGAQGFKIGQSLFQRRLADDIGQYTEFHNDSTLLCILSDWQKNSLHTDCLWIQYI